MPCRDYDYEDLDNVTPTQLDDLRTKNDKPDILRRLKLY
jgi:hypothetical protein